MQAIPLELRYVIPEKGYEKFWEGLKRGEIWATKCNRCGSIYYPPQRDCPTCFTSGLEWYRVSNRGEIMTYTKVKAKPQGYEKVEDYTIGIVRTDDGVSLMCWIKGEPKVGVKVNLTTDGERVIGEVV